MKVIIIGNGILGLTIAFRLLQKPNSVDEIVLIGPSDRKGSATMAAPAMLNSFAEIEEDSFDSELGTFRFELSHLATQMWPDFQNEISKMARLTAPKESVNDQMFSEEGGIDQGTFVINNTYADDLDDKNYDAIISGLNRFGGKYEEVLPADIPNYHPSQRSRATRAIYINGEGWINPRLMVAQLQAILENSSRVTLVKSMAKKMIHSYGSISGVEVCNGDIHTADNYVLATGASVNTLLETSALDINVQRVFYGQGVSIEIKSPKHVHKKCIRTPNRGMACGVYTVPYSACIDNDHIMIGSTGYVSPKPISYINSGDISHLLNSAIEQINSNFYQSQFIRANYGWRPMTQDTYPLIGRSSINNLVIMSGTRREGFHMSPVLSKIISDILLGFEVDERISLFSPERDLIRNISREDAINKAISHRINAYYQHGFVPSQGNMIELFKKMYRKEVEDLHDSVGAYEWGIPVDMLGMYREGHAVVSCEESRMRGCVV